VGTDVIGAPGTFADRQGPQKMMGDEASARRWYEDFLALWKDADPDVPIYQQAKAEYAQAGKRAGARTDSSFIQISAELELLFLISWKTPPQLASALEVLSLILPPVNCARLALRTLIIRSF